MTILSFSHSSVESKSTLEFFIGSAPDLSIQLGYTGLILGIGVQGSNLGIPGVNIVCPEE